MKWFVNERLELMFHNMLEIKIIPTEQALVLDTFERFNSSFII